MSHPTAIVSSDIAGIIVLTVVLILLALVDLI